MPLRGRSPWRARRSSEICLASSSGGHLELLSWIRSRALASREVVWVTSPSRRAEAIAASGEPVRELPPWDKGDFRPRYLLDGARLAWRLRPGVVVTTGAGMVVPFCLVARLLGAQLIFVETMARIDTPSSSGRVLARLARRTLVQWPEMQSVYPRAVACRPMLLEAVRPVPADPGDGTFVAVGTHSAPFDRLLRVADEAVVDGVLPQPARAQTGAGSYTPRGLVASAWLDPDELTASLQGSRYIVSHMGSGLVAAALRAGRRPLVMPREAARGEHVDDHQVSVARRLEALDLVVVVGDRIDRDHLERADRPLPAVLDGDAAATVEGQLSVEIAALG